MSAALAFALSNWRWLLPVAIFAVLAIDDGYHRIALSSCREARTAEHAAADRAKAEALARAQATSDAIITEQAQALAQTASKAQNVIERIVRVPVTNGCGPAVHDALGSLPDIIGSGGGQTPAVRRAPVGLH